MTQVQFLTRTDAIIVAEVRDGSRAVTITASDHYVHCTCGWRASPEACRHVQAYRRAAVTGRHLIVRDSGGPLFVILHKSVLDPALSDAYSLALDLLPGAASPAVHAAAVQILAFARTHGATLPPTRAALGTTRRIVIVDDPDA